MAATPPKFVPTLTEVLGGQRPPTLQPLAPSKAEPGGGDRSSPQDWSEQEWTARVMQDVDLALEAKLRQVVNRVVSEQLASLLPTLHNEIEDCVSQAVRVALARQLR